MAKKKSKTTKDNNKKVNQTVTNLAAPSRENNRLSTSWGYNDNAFKDDNAARFVGVLCRWLTNGYGGPENLHRPAAGNGTTSDFIDIGRGYFYPCTGYKLNGMTFEVQGYNIKSPNDPVYQKNKKTKKKERVVTPWNVYWDPTAPTASVWYGFTKPAAPGYEGSVEKDSGTNHICSVKVTANNDANGTAERYDTISTKWYRRSMTTNGKQFSTSGWVKVNNNYAQTTATSFTMTMNPNDYMTGSTSGQRRTLMGMIPGEYIEFWFESYNRGYAGDSGKVKYTYLYAWPHDTTMKKIENLGNFYRITFSTNGVASNQARKTQKFTLQKLDNYKPSGSDDWSDAQWLNSAAAASGWSDCYSIGNAERQFTYPKRDVNFEDFHRSYFRVKAESEIAGLGPVYSTPLVVPGFKHIPSARNEHVQFLEAASTDDGKAIRAVVAFNITKTDGVDNSNGTEISWDEDAYAWQSNQAPSSFDMPDSQFKNSLTAAVKQKRGWSSSLAYYAEVYIRGIQTSTAYFLKARRFLDSEARSSVSYGPYADYSSGTGEGAAVASITPAAKPVKVTMAGPTIVPRGKDFSVMWSFEGDAQQTQYMVAYLPSAAEADLSKAKALKSATDSAEYAIFKYSEVEDKLYNDSLYLCVKVQADSSWSEFSKPITIKFSDPPTARLSVPSQITAKPLVFTIGTNDVEAKAVVRVISKGISMWTPYGKEVQSEGEVVYSEKLSPDWLTDEEHGGYYANVEVPMSADFKDNGTYVVEYYAINDTSHLSSATIDENGDEIGLRQEVDIHWAHQAVPPSRMSYITSVQGTTHAEIHLIQPETGYVETDVCDIYRVTPDGAYLVYSGAPFGVTVIDKYAPYSKYAMTRYRLCTRTVDGDIDWIDVGYRVPAYWVRFDWGDSESEENGGYNYVELPYNLDYTDNFSKNVRVQQHLDGLYQAYWRGGVERKNSLSTAVAKYEEPEQVERIKALARYAGPVMVRLPDGCAFAANVNVSSVQNTYNSLIIAASFDAQEIALPPQYQISSGNVIKLDVKNPSEYDGDEPYVKPDETYTDADIAQENPPAEELDDETDDQGTADTGYDTDYVPVDAQEGDNPLALGWYEFVDDQYVLSTDIAVDPEKSYYALASGN